MTPTRQLVLDASVGVKWFKREAGSEEALQLLRQSADGTVTLVVPFVFCVEVLEVFRRRHGATLAREFWQRLQDDGLVILGRDKESLVASLDWAQRLGCTLYDAAAPAVADQLGARLVSADAQAHGEYPQVRLIG